MISQLEELEITGSMNIKWLNFIIQNRVLRFLNINWALDLQQWTMIVENLPYLDELKTQWHSSNKGNGLIALMNGDTNLKRVTFDMRHKIENHTILRDSLYPRWQIDGETQDIMKEIVFIRNN